MGITGDCPAISLLCNFINHNGFFSCWYCFIRGETRQRKRQYDEMPLQLRSVVQFAKFAHEAQLTGECRYGHYGLSVIHELLDVPLPNSIIIDYLHVTLLGHTKRIIMAIYSQISPLQRLQLNDAINSQQFPRDYFHN